VKRLAAVLAVLSVACQEELPPRGEVVLHVDTDLAVPRLAGRLRVDLYQPDGTWYESRDTALPDARDWPTSFSLYHSDDSTPRRVWVRLRVYPHGRVREYLGERFTPAPDPLPADELAPQPAATGEPRLLDHGSDATPPTEPLPELAVDRLLELEIPAGQRRHLGVVLRGACIGTMADLTGRTTCVDTPRSRVDASSAPLAGSEVPKVSSQGAFGAPTGCDVALRPPSQSADGASLFDEEVCVPGSLFVFGSAGVFGAGPQSALPERAAIVRPVAMDRYEVTVGRWRAALDAGFLPQGFVFANEGPLATGSGSGQGMCTWSSAPMGREHFAINCLTWSAALSFCEFHGAGLPSEVEWEHAATAAARADETLYPWGNAVPTCDRAVYGRWDATSSGGTDCKTLGFGPVPVDVGQDVTPSIGVVGLGGGLTEWLRDTALPLTTRCWASAPLQDPGCDDPAQGERSARGGNWSDNAIQLRAPMRKGYAAKDAGVGIGFRCSRPGRKEAP